MRNLIPAVLIALAGCSQPDAPPADNSLDLNTVDLNGTTDVTGGKGDANVDAVVAPADTPTPTPVPASTPSPAPLNPPAPGTPGGLPDDRTPISEAPFTPESAQGAANVVQTYYALLGEGKYRQAWGLWDHGGQDSGMSAQSFAASFGRYTEYHANVGAPGEIDAGAGQRYVTVPVQVYGRLKRDGSQFNMLGSVTLHRVGDIDGATQAQKSWHLHSADIKPRPGQAPLPGGDAAAPAVATATYRCIDGSRVAVRFDNRPDTATLAEHGRVIAVLDGQRPASGIWYKGGGYELRGKGSQAMLTRPKLPPLACTS